MRLRMFIRSAYVSCCEAPLAIHQTHCRNAHNLLQAPDLLFLGNYAASSPIPPARVGAILAPPDTFHHLAKQSDAAAVCHHGRLGVHIGGVELDGFPGELEGASEGATRRWRAPVFLRGLQPIGRGRGRRLVWRA